MRYESESNMSEAKRSSEHICEDEKRASEGAIQKQYELVIGVYQSESGRFWTRFNIFTGIQFGGMLGVLASVKVLAANPLLFRYLMIMCALLSSLVVLVCIRGIMSTRMLLRMIAHVESRSKELLPLVALTKELDRLPQYVNFILAVVTSIVLSVAWWAALIYLEGSNYQIMVPK